MTNSIGLKQSVAQHSNIACKSVCFGLIKKLYYKPTNSSLKSIELYFGPKDKETLLSLFKLQGEALISFTKKCPHLDEKTNGNLLLEAFVSSDRQFMALPIATSAFPSNAPIKLTTNSGIEVPIPTMAAPITKSDTLYLRAIAAAPATNISAPKTIPTKEIIRMMYSIIQQLTMYK